jgi:RNA methyltransferase, TrmH family
MLSRNQIKLINSLRLSKYRLEEGLFIAEGIKLVDELLRSNFKIHSIYALPEWIAAGHIPQNRYLVEINQITQLELEKISTLGTPNQVLALAKIPVSGLLPDISGEWIMMLDQLRDPGNLGTIIRTADWFGIDRIIVSLNSVDVWNPKVVQASMGSVFRIPVYSTDLETFLSENNRKVPVYGTFLKGELLTDIKFKQEGIVVIGNESNGITDRIMPYITSRITIPAATTGYGGRAESLNASVAAAVLCYEIRKQHPK